MTGDARVRRLTLVIPSLTGGGAERMIVDLATQFANRAWAVTLVTIESRARDFYELPPTVSRVALDLSSPSPAKLDILRFVLRATRRLRRAIAATQPDVVLSFMEITNILVLLAARGTRWPVVVAERTDPRQHRVSWVWAALRRRLYPLAAGVTVQTESVAEWARTFLPAARVHVIPNAARPVALRAGRATESDERIVVAVGRLGVEKGFDLLIDAAEIAFPRHPAWVLVIVGDGPERRALQSRARRSRIADRIRFEGRVAHPEEILHGADLFVLSSRYEGFPNSLMEAMATGLPVLSTDCPSGPAAMIRDGVDGRLVPPNDVAALAGGLEELLGDEPLRNRLASRAPEVLERFNPERVLARWETLLREVGRPAAMAPTTESATPAAEVHS